MPSISVHLGRSLFLACCGSLMYFGEDRGNSNGTKNFNETDTINVMNINNVTDASNVTNISNVTNSFNEYDAKRNTSYPSWIASPSHKNVGNETLDNKVTEVDIKIVIPTTDGRESEENQTDSKATVVNQTDLKGSSNIVQINIFNNGAPISFPRIIKTENLSANTSSISISSGGVMDAAPPILSPVSPAPMYEPPKEDSMKDVLPWWKTSIIYQIYPRSFRDTTGSGTGDLPGITSKLDYLKNLGVGAVWLNPIYVSPMVDFGYDVADFRNVDPIFGSLEDFDTMKEEMHKRGLKLIMDFIPNHSSDKHAWFQSSLNRVDPYTDYYVWEKPKGFNETGDPIPPNNWLSVFGGSAWEWSPEREEFYLHQFLKEQPDLNVRNPLVMEELDDILRFWLDRGVDGFRVDALKFLYESEDKHLDEPADPNSETQGLKEHESLRRTLTVNRPETVEAVKRWRNVIDEYDDRLMIVEVYDNNIEEVSKYYETPANPLAHFPFNFYLITEFRNRSDVTGAKLKEVLELWLNSMPSTSNWPNWVLGNHDRSRVSTRLGATLVDAMNMLLLLLPGTPTTYYGEEIGMEDTHVSYEEAKDPFGLNFGPERYLEFGRDPYRTPMQWDDTANAGFSNANSTWLPINPNYPPVNVKTQESHERSHLTLYKELAQLRSKETFRRGNYSFPYVTDNLFVLKRSLEGEPSYLLLINTSEDVKVTTEDLLTESNEEMPSVGKVIIRSSLDERQETSPGSELNLSSITLRGGEGLVIELMEQPA